MKNKIKKEVKKNKISAGKVIAIGAGVAAIGAGAYYFLGPNGKKNQKKAKVWMTKMEKEAEGKVKKIKNATLPMYHNTVDTLVETYSKQYKEHAPEIKAFAKHLKNNWKGIGKKAKTNIKKKK
jgi:DNA helicase TIP49 (TBP-interacting protein)